MNKAEGWEMMGWRDGGMEGCGMMSMDVDVDVD